MVVAQLRGPSWSPVKRTAVMSRCCGLEIHGGLSPRIETLLLQTCVKKNLKTDSTICEACQTIVHAMHMRDEVRVLGPGMDGPCIDLSHALCPEVLDAANGIQWHTSLLQVGHGQPRHLQLSLPYGRYLR